MGLPMRARMNLEQNEQIILYNKFPKSKRNLTLTNKRLIFQEKRKIITEISLTQIEKVHGAKEIITSSSSLILDLKDGEQIQVTFEIPSCGEVIPEESKKITDTFLTAINHQIKMFL
jgi:hypothetical protein